MSNNFNPPPQTAGHVNDQTLPNPPKPVSPGVDQPQPQPPIPHTRQAAPPPAATPTNPQSPQARTELKEVVVSILVATYPSWLPVDKGSLAEGQDALIGSCVLFMSEGKVYKIRKDVIVGTKSKYA